MVNKPKNIGTAAESAVVKYAKTRGFPAAERLALHGGKDIGDVRLRPGFHLEVKAGAQAQNPSPRQVGEWMEEAAVEGANAGAACFLVTRRKGYGSPGDWRVWLTMGELIWTLEAYVPDNTEVVVSMDLAGFLTVMVDEEVGEEQV